MKSILILQYFGLGDIIWSQSIAQHFIKQGYKVVWPVSQHYLDGCQRAYPDICFVPDTIIKPEIFDIKEKVDVDGILIAPIRWSDSYMKLPYKDVMKAKFLMYDLDWKTWKTHARWQRDIAKEKELMNVLEIKPETKFNLINKTFGANFERNVEIEVNNEYKNIELTKLNGFSLFDWTMVILAASEIHSVSTSLVYILECLKIKVPIHLYCRKPIEYDFNYINFIFTKPYITHL